MEKYWLWLLMTFGVGESRLEELIKRYETAEKIYNAFQENTDADAYISSVAKKISLEEAEALAIRLADRGISILTRDNIDFPESLLRTENPPVLLFARGNTKILNNKTLTVTGSRSITEYTVSAQRSVLNRLLSEYTLVTTLCYGCDQLSCLCAIKSGKPIIEILVSGFDSEHPAGSRVLREEIIESGGCVITEYLPETKAAPVNYLRRAKLLGSFSPATLVFQAGMASGALKIASFSKAPYVIPPYDVFAAEYAGAVYAVRNGAALYYDISDLEAPYAEGFTPNAPKLKPPKLRKPVKEKKNKVQPAEAAPEEKTEAKIHTEEDFESKYHFEVYKAISEAEEAVAFDIILRKTDVDITELSEILLDLEIEGIIKAQAGNRYSAI